MQTKDYPTMYGTSDFIDKHVTEVLYKKIIKELRTNADGTMKEDSGRKRELTREILRHYLFVLSMSGDYKFSAESAGYLVLSAFTTMAKTPKTQS